MTIAPALLAATTEHLSHHLPFQDMAREELAWMIARLKVGYYAKDEVVLGPDSPVDTFFIVKQGVVVAERGEAQRDTWLTLHEGECFPFAALISARPVVSRYRATTDVFCFELSASDFAQLMQRSRVFADFCTHRLAHLFGQAKRSLQSQYARASSEQFSLAHPVSAVMRREPVSCRADTPLREVLSVMAQRGIGSMVAVDDSLRPLGIFTLRDVLPRVVLPGVGLDTPLSAVMTREPFCMPPHSFAHDCALAMARHGFRHVLVTEHERLVGLVSERDLFALQRLGLRQISDTLRHADSLATLKAAAGDIRQLAHTLLAQGVGAEQLVQIISTLNDVLTARVIQLELAGSPAASVAFCWIALGSEGRLEQTLNTDQDNGIIFIPPAGSDAHATRALLLPFARKVNLALAECGFPLCAGEVMASNPKWCLSLEEWQRTFAQWIDQGDPTALLNASIFFDFRALQGEAGLATTLREWLRGHALTNPRFLHQMSANALRNRPPLGLVREFSTADDGTLDLKMNGVTPFVDGARILALAHGARHTGTVARLRELISLGALKADEGEALIDAFLFIQLLRLRLHHEQEHAGEPLTNRVTPGSLNALDRRILREAFRQARKLQARLELDYKV